MHGNDAWVTSLGAPVAASWLRFTRAWRRVVPAGTSPGRRSTTAGVAVRIAASTAAIVGRRASTVPSRVVGSARRRTGRRALGATTRSETVIRYRDDICHEGQHVPVSSSINTPSTRRPSVVVTGRRSSTTPSISRRGIITGDVPSKTRPSPALDVRHTEGAGDRSPPERREQADHQEASSVWLLPAVGRSRTCQAAVEDHSCPSRNDRSSPVGEGEDSHEEGNQRVG